MSRKAVTEFTVLQNQVVGYNLNLLVLQSENALLPVTPGQFVNIEIPGNADVFLRRPFSVFDFDPQNNTLSILSKELGKGSYTLNRVREGCKLSLVYPLGKGFTLPGKGDRILAVGGGSGIAPLLFLARTVQGFISEMDVLFGARSAQDHITPESMGSAVSFHYITEDGTLGETGLVTQHPLMDQISGYDRVYACGPLQMMKAVASKAKASGVFCEVSLENVMACGFGVCLCCIEPTVQGNLCVCTAGPVFNINDLLWQI